METTYELKYETTLLVTKPVEVAPIEAKEYKLDFLKQQEVAILKQKNDYIEARDKELLEVREMISQAEGLGIKSEIAVKLEAETVREEALIK